MNKRTVVLICFLLFAVIGRFTILAGTNWVNFSPMGAVAIFAGYYFKDKKSGYLLTILSLWISNLILNNFLYQSTYKSFSFGIEIEQFALFAGIVGLGHVYSSKTKSLFNFLSANLLTVFGFFILSNFLVWLGSDIAYSKDLSGLLLCYTNAIPFLGNALGSQMLFSALFFASFEFLQSRVPALR